jgi:uncharacterized repeat protein (TIGR01451 family)
VLYSPVTTAPKKAPLKWGNDYKKIPQTLVKGLSILFLSLLVSTGVIKTAHAQTPLLDPGLNIAAPPLPNSNPGCGLGESGIALLGTNWVAGSTHDYFSNGCLTHPRGQPPGNAAYEGVGAVWIYNPNESINQNTKASCTFNPGTYYVTTRQALSSDTSYNPPAGSYISLTFDNKTTTEVVGGVSASGWELVRYKFVLTAAGINKPLRIGATSGGSPASGNWGFYVDDVKILEADGVTEVCLQPSLKVTKTASTTVFYVGQPASYTIKIDNVGGVASTPTTLTDPIPAGLTIDPLTLPSACSAIGQAVTCTVASLPAYTGTVSFVIPVTPATTNATGVTNTATVQGGGDPTCPAAANCKSSVGPIPIKNQAVLGITKTASASTFVVGALGQKYSLVVTVANGPTTAPIFLKDAFPTGITLSGPITTSAGTLSNCLGAGNLSLGTLCQLAAGLANGTHTITIPVTVGASATTGTNTASISGGDSAVCTTASPCSATTPLVAVIDAVNDAVTVKNNTVNNTNLIGNDTIPAGSAITFVSSTCPGPTATVSPIGVASYTSPATAPGSCNVVYKICAPAPDDAICDTATLTVTATAAAPIISVTKLAVPGAFIPGLAGQKYTLTITINNGPTTAPIVLSDTLPTGITTSGAVTTSFGSLSGCPTSSGDTTLGAACQLATGLSSGVHTITIPVNVATNATAGLNVVNVTGGGSICTLAAPCTDSTPAVPILDTNNDAANAAPGATVSTFNLLTNDKIPAGSTITLDPTTPSTCVGSAVSATGIATYTAPTTAGATCTVVYKVCAPAPNAAVCDISTLTVTASATPSISVIKASSPAVFVVGAASQNYTIKVTVANGPTTAPIVFSDALPTGITTNGTITTSGGTLSGCPLSGATNLGSACQLATNLASGIYTITIPVATGASATTATNTAGVTGGGSTTCTTSAPCSATTPPIPVLDAVADAVSKPLSTPSTYTLIANDKIPADSTITMTSSTCPLPAATVNASGVASFTTPATVGGTCLITYKVCAAAPNGTICDSAVLTVTATATPSIVTITKTSSAPTFVVGASGQSYAITVTVANGPTTAAILLNDPLPSGVTTSGAVTTSGGTLANCSSAAASTSLGATCQLNTALANGTYTITVPVSVAVGTTSASNTATASGGGSTCTVATPCSATTNPPVVVIDAVDDAVSNPPGTVVTGLDIKSNDTVPVGAVIGTGTGSTCVGAAVNGAGQASYTAPAAGSTCTVVYTVCVGAVCDTATLTVSGAATPILMVTKTVSVGTGVMVVGAPASYTLKIDNTGAAASIATTIKDTIPNGLTIGILPAACSAAGQDVTCNVGILAATSGTVSFTIPVTPTAASAPGVTNSAALQGGDPACPAAARCTSSVGPTVIRSAITAAPDTITALSGVTDSASAESVIANDNLNGISPILTGLGANTVLTSTPPAPSPSAPAGNTNVPMIDPLTGKVVVPANTPAGTYSIPYKICELANPTNCATTTATVTIVAPALGLAKKLSKIEQLSTGTYRATFEVLVANTGTGAATNVQIADNLAAAFPAPVVITSVNGLVNTIQAGGATAAICAVNPTTPLPVTSVNLMAGNQALASNASCTYQLAVTFASNGAKGPFANKATASSYVSPPATPGGNNPSAVIISTSSDSGSDPRGSNPGEPGDTGGVSDATPIDLPSALTGSVWLDAGAGAAAGNRQRDPSEMGAATTPGQAGGLADWTVVAVYPKDHPKAGQVAFTTDGKSAQAKTDANGNYVILGLPAGNYQVKFMAPGATPVQWGTPVNGEHGIALAGSTSSPTSRTLDVTMVAGTNMPEQSLPVDPSGVVYNAVSRDPVGGAVVQLGSQNGTVFTPLPAACLLPSQQAQTTSATGPMAGAYRFDIVTGADPACPVGATNYTLQVTPPAGFTSPSNIISTSGNLAVPNGAGSFRVVAGPTAPAVGTPTTYYNSFTISSSSQNVVHNHWPLDPATKAVLFIEKLADGRTVEIGDSMSYRIKVRNPNAYAIPAVQVVDKLPLGFKLISGTSTVTVGTASATTVGEPTGAPGPNLTYVLGTVASNTDVIITYRVRVGIGADKGTGINTAQAIGAGGTVNSLVAQAKVQVTGGVFTTQACIIGKVYVDCNQNKVQDAGEPGIPGVRLYMQDGTNITTDENGQYSFCGVRPITHVIKVDPTTMPVGARLGVTSSRNAGDADMLILDPKNGELHRADFREMSCFPKVLEQVHERRRLGPVIVPEKQGGKDDPWGTVFSSEQHRLERTPALIKEGVK